MEEKNKVLGIVVGTATAAVSALYLLMQRVRAAPPKPLTLQFEQPLGESIDNVDSGTEFYCVGFYREDTKPLPEETIYVYQMHADGTPTDVYKSGVTNEKGRYEIPWTAPSVDKDTNYYFTAFDEVQRP